LYVCFINKIFLLIYFKCDDASFTNYFIFLKAL
jgi:hypothetical protein